VTAAADRVGAQSVGQFALSGIYSAVYYQGVADELGSPASFWELLAASRPETTRNVPVRD
jgi:hypothetical protein